MRLQELNWRAAKEIKVFRGAGLSAPAVSRTFPAKRYLVAATSFNTANYRT